MKNLTETDVRKLLSATIKAKGLRAFGREHDIDPSHARRVDGGAPLSPTILTALGLEVASTKVTYRRIRK